MGWAANMTPKPQTMPMPQDPLAQLRDIHTPPAIEFWPLAPGWWFLIALILFTLACLCIVWQRHRQQTAYKRAALSQLQQIQQQSQSDKDFLQAINSLLKQTALATQTRSDIASLSGDTWLNYLDQISRQDFFVNEGKVLATGPYQAEAPSINREQFLQGVQRWIKGLPKQC